MTVLDVHRAGVSTVCDNCGRAVPRGGDYWTDRQSGWALCEDCADE